MVRVKICGITHYEDARSASEAGADYLGFIFYPPSPRAISPRAAAEIVARLRQQAAGGPRRTPRLVGVFVNEPVERIAATLERCRLDLAQLSGDEEPAAVTDPASSLFGRAYQCLRLRSLSGAEEKVQLHAAPDRIDGPRLLLDTPYGMLYGGSGAVGDWAIGALASSTLPRLMLAGGLTPDNVAEAVRHVRPFAVDVASGVEAGPGKKDPTLVRAFIQRAKASG